MRELKPPIENVNHTTLSRPFSMHHTVVSGNDDRLLYTHCHPEAEFFYMEQGRAEFVIENRSYLLNAGDSIFIPPNLIHRAVRINGNTEECSFYALVFSVEQLKEYLPPYCHVYFSAVENYRAECIYHIRADEEENVLILRLLRRAFEEMEADLSRYELSLMGTLQICWQELYTRHFSRIGEGLGVHARHDELQKSVDYLHEHYTEQIVLSELADMAGFSEGHFCRSFKEYTGLTPFECLSRVRIIKSCEYLSQTEKKITEIALLCGFNDISYYNRVFHKVMGMKPSLYRKQNNY